MTTTLEIQITSQGLLIPRNALQDWGEIEIVQTEQHIILRPKTVVLRQERELAIQALREDGLLYEYEPVEGDLPDISDTERTELAKKLKGQRPLSEIIIEAREDRV